MNELISETVELEKDIQDKVAEGVGSRAEEQSSSYFGYSLSLERVVLAGRLESEEACRRRHIAAWCTARSVSDIVRRYQTCRAELDRRFAEFRQREAGIRHANNN
jgi:hypothetical protein